MFINEHFIFDNRSSQEFGISNIRVSSDLIEVPFGVNRNIVEDKVNGGNNFYFYGMDKEPLSFTLTFSLLEEAATFEKRIELVRWLFQDSYKPFISDDNPEIVYYAIAIGDSKFFDNGFGQGYFQVQFRCSAPHAFSSIYVQDFDLSNNAEHQTIILENKSNILKYYYPEITIEMKGSTDITLKNNADGGREFIFAGLLASEIVYINNHRKQIISNQNGVYRYNNFNKNWLRLPYGTSQIEVTGRCKLQVRSQFPIAI